MRNPDAAAANQGFTLIEVIVSFIVLAMVLGTVMLSVSNSARLQRQADAKRIALACAQQVLAERFHRKRGQPATDSGSAGDNCRWRITRMVIQARYTESGRNLMRFRIETMGVRGNPIDTFERYYVEDAR